MKYEIYIINDAPLMMIRPESVALDNLNPAIGAARPTEASRSPDNNAWALASILSCHLRVRSIAIIIS